MLGEGEAQPFVGASRGAAPKRVTTCPVCGLAGAKASRLLELPRFPLTGIYIRPQTPPEAQPYARYDNAWLVCADCGHGYMEWQLPASVLYGSPTESAAPYTHRSSSSGIARAGNDVLWAFIQRITHCDHEETRFRSVLEIGCNDFYLTSKLRDVADTVTGVDPIWRSTPDAPNTPDVKFSNVVVCGQTVEEFEIWRQMQHRPDLVVAAHTIEHVGQPYEQMKKLVEGAADDALMVVEVPLQDAMVAGARFDQVFHQHVQYFSYASMAAFVERLGCVVVAWDVNWRYWGGTLMVAFAKALAVAAGRRGIIGHPPLGHPPLPAGRLSRHEIERQIRVFRDRCRGVLHDMLAFVADGGSAYAFGASQMLPALVYHMPYGWRDNRPPTESEPSWLSGIIDDNPSRVGCVYPGWPGVPIIEPAALVLSGSWKYAGVWVSALDSARDIVRRAIRFEPRVIFPLMWRG